MTTFTELGRISTSEECLRKEESHTFISSPSQYPSYSALQNRENEKNRKNIYIYKIRKKVYFLLKMEY